jgi:thioredoxin:protein disulfide reductase
MRLAERWIGTAVASLACILAAPLHAAQDSELLAPEEAFRVSARIGPNKAAELRFEIAPDHYLYKKRFRFALNGRPIKLSGISFPRGRVTQDPTFGKVETYSGTLQLALGRADPDKHGKVALEVTSQGCAAKTGVCYPPITSRILLDAGTGEWAQPTGSVFQSFSGKPRAEKFTSP